jgi:hypothetical protein
MAGTRAGRKDDGLPSGEGRQGQLDWITLWITGHEDPLGPELSIGVEYGHKGLPSRLELDLHPTGRDGQTGSQAGTLRRETEADELGDKLVLVPEKLQSHRVQAVQVPSSPGIGDAALGHQEVLASREPRDAGRTEEDHVHQPGPQNIGVGRNFGVRPRLFGDAI